MSAVTGHPHGSGPAHSSWRSAPVKAATTPGIARAGLRSIDEIRAWAAGLRTRAAWRAPGTTRSATKRASPVSSAGSSRRRIRVPTTRVATPGGFSTAVTTPPAPSDAARTACTMLW